MRIAYICADFGIPVFGFKGASVHVREMIAAWQRLGHEVVVFSPRVEKQAGVTANIQTIAVEPSEIYYQAADELRTLDNFLGMSTRVRHDLRNLLYHMALYETVEPIMQSEPFDFVYERYTLFHYGGLALAHRFDLPHVLEVNAPLCYEQEKMRGLEMKQLAHDLERRIFTETDSLCVVSEQLGEFVQSRGVTPERVLLTPNGVNPRVFKPQSSAGALVREKYGLGDHPVIGFVGSLKPWHGTDSLVDAFAGLQAAGNDARLFIVGDGPQREALMAQGSAAGLSDQIIFTGKIPHDQIPAYIAAMDVTVAPYIPHDNFYFSPIKLFEYMAVGKPVIAGGIGQTEEVVVHGETGLLYPPGDELQLQQSLQQLVNDPDLCVELGQAGRDWVVTERTWDSNAGRVLEAVRQIKNANKMELV